MGDLAEERWQLHDLEIDAGAQTVSRDRQLIVLPNLSFKFLLELVRAAPKVLSVDELMDRVWDGVFVSAETVTQRAKLLRDALGDDPRNPVYFNVRRGVGYQIIGEPVRMDPAGGSARKPAAAAGRWRVFAAALMLIAGFAAATYWYTQTSEAAAQHPLRVAVLPFDNLSADPADAYIAQGFPEMVLNRLASIQGLAVISRESALLQTGAETEPALAGKQLEADFVVKGSVQRAGATLRVTSFVLYTKGGTRLWSQSYDWPVDRLYALQDRIAEQVAQALASKAPLAGKLREGPPAASNSDAYLAYLKGRALLGRFRVADTEAAAVQFQRAIELDPNFAPAMVALADARMQGASLRSEDLGEEWDRHRGLIERAEAIDPESGALLFAKAMWSNQSREDRLQLFRRAAMLDPSNSRGLVAYAQFLEWGGNDGPPSKAAQALMDRVMAIDPLSADAQFWAVQRKVFKFSTPADVEAAQREALKLDPGNVLLANRYAVRRWRFSGETAEAIELMERILASDPEYARSAQVAYAMYLDVGDVAAARSVAESTPATRQASRAVFALHAGDWRAAGEAAMGPRGFLFNQFENWLWPEAVRDYALKSGQLERGARAIASRYGFDLSNPRVTALYQMTPSVPLGQILLAQGKDDLANRFLAQSVRWLDEHPKLGLGGGTGRAKAGALMLLGQRDQALSVLLATTRSAHDIHHCWYLTGHDPVWASVRADPRFREVATVCAASVKSQRAKVEQLRREGKVPRRAG